MKNEKKNVWKSIAVIVIVLSILAIAMVGAASAKSLYAIANHHTKQFDAWNINPDGSATYQFKVSLVSAYAPADIAIDESSNVLFITSEGMPSGRMVEIVDATTMTILGYVTGPTTNNAGIEADDANDVVYMMQRGTPKLYAFDWNPSTSSLTIKSGFPKTLAGGGWGIALDETTGILWVCDGSAKKVRAYSTTTWTEDTSKSFTPTAHGTKAPVDVAVDRQRGFVYTVSMSYGAWSPGGSNYLSKWDGSMETKVNLGHQGVGVAVDEVTGYVYVIGDAYAKKLETWDTSTSPWTRVDIDSVSGSPAGICVPQEEVSYNPLNLAKDDGLGGACVNAGATMTYTISYTNGNPNDVTGVTITDILPSEVTYQSCTGGCSQSGNTVTWNIGTVTPGTSGSVTLTVQVNSGTEGSKITNSATIDSDQTPQTTVNKQTDVCSVSVPEFTTIAIPVAGILGMVLLISLRRRKEQ